MNPSRTLTPKYLALAALLAGSTALAAGSDQLAVSATVARHASMQVLAQPAFLQLTPVDIGRGYVDLPGSSQVAIRSNSPEGYLVMLSSEADFVTSTVLRGLSTDVQWGAAGGAVAQRATGPGMSRQLLALSYRFMLSPTARPGTYAWPVRLAVSPL